MSTVIAPLLTRQHYDVLRKSQRTLHDMIPNIDRCEACGIDCEAWRQQVAYLSQLLTAIETNFFPQPPV